MWVFRQHTPPTELSCQSCPDLCGAWSEIFVDIIYLYHTPGVCKPESLGSASALIYAFRYNFNQARNGQSCNSHESFTPSFCQSVCEIIKAICLSLHDLLQFPSLYKSHGRNRILFQSEYVSAFAEKTTRVLGIIKVGLCNFVCRTLTLMKLQPCASPRCPMRWRYSYLVKIQPALLYFYRTHP